jgi:hypothetical protein
VTGFRSRLAPLADQASTVWSCFHCRAQVHCPFADKVCVTLLRRSGVANNAEDW